MASHRLGSPSRRRLLCCGLTSCSRLCQVAQPAMQVASAIALRFVSRRFIFTIAAVSLLAAKVVHVMAYYIALSASDIHWALTFFTQDTLVILLLRFLLDHNPNSFLAARRWLAVLATTLASFVVLFVLALASISISFFFVAGSELHWRNAALASDSSSWKLLLTGLFSFAIVVAAVVVVSWIAQDLFYLFAGVALDIVKWPVSALLNRLSPICRFCFCFCFSCRRRRGAHSTAKYAHVPLLELEGGGGGGASEFLSKEEEGLQLAEAPVGLHIDEPPRVSTLMVGVYCMVGLVMFLQVALYFARPDETSLTFMSWTLPLLPFVDIARSSPALANLRPIYGTVDTFGYRTALAEPPNFPWLPKGTPLDGFQDWYEKDAKHYRASEDPLKISNLGQPLLAKLKDSLGNTTIRHVVLVKLESTRKDVFPIRKDGFIWKQLAGTFDNKTLPDAAVKRLSTLSPTANFLTGDYEDGFEHQDGKKRRGGINVNQAHTSATYTLKSLTGTICGLSPLVVDFNTEVSHHFYQPCLPQIFEAFNHNLDRRQGDEGDDDFTSYRWKPWFMQSVTKTYDKQDQLMVKLGFPENNTIYKEYLKSSDAKFGVVEMEDVNYYGMPEVAIEDYVRDAFVLAKQNKERVFLTHLTSSTHHAFGLPADEEVVKLAADGKLENLSGYLNAVGYVDRWLKRVLDILDEQGVADETLVVLVGDHGVSVAENDGITPYYNPNIGNFHVPLVFSHPRLPAIDVDDAVVSYQILPTILDMLLETGSLSPSQAKVASDLVHNYEGQSLIRPLVHYDDNAKQANWQFSVMNPGRATIAVRDGRHTLWRLTVPVIENTEWRFTDLEGNAHEEKATVSFSFSQMLRKVESTHSLEAAKWAEEAAFVARWWVEENARRWRYNPSQ